MDNADDVFGSHPALMRLDRECSFWKIERAVGDYSTRRLDLTVRLRGVGEYVTIRGRSEEPIWSLVSRAIVKAIARSSEVA